VVRRFPPGSEWLYAKLYTGAATADQVLRQVVRPVTEAALRCGAADGWFFIRYGDPDWHLRLRLHGRPSSVPTVAAACPAEREDCSAPDHGRSAAGTWVPWLAICDRVFE
jgi:hypothetical protein